MSALFFYGTLRFKPLLDIVLGASGDVSVKDADLPGHSVHWVENQSFPLIVPDPGGRAKGLLVQGLDEAAIARLNFYEGGFSYDLRDMSVNSQGETLSASIYFPEEGRWVAGAPWSLDDWQRDWGNTTLHFAREVMSYFGHLSREQVEQRVPMIRMRASTKARAGTPAPTTLRTDFGPGDLETQSARRPYSNYFTLEEHDIAFRRFDGSMSAVVNRAGFVGGDAVTVLPYDPVRDRVLVIEQFRFGPHLRGDPHPWVLEPIAGRIDPGESPETCARREAVEETGLTLTALEHIADYYPSPGAVSEFVMSYVGLADLPDGVAGIGGVAHEHEDIRSHVISPGRLIELVQTGEAGCGPLVLSALWLIQNRDRLRGAA